MECVTKTQHKRDKFPMQVFLVPTLRGTPFLKTDAHTCCNSTHKHLKEGVALADPHLSR